MTPSVGPQEAAAPVGTAKDEKVNGNRQSSRTDGSAPSPSASRPNRSTPPRPDSRDSRDGRDSRNDPRSDKAPERRLAEPPRLDRDALDSRPSRGPRFDPPAPEPRPVPPLGSVPPPSLPSRNRGQQHDTPPPARQQPNRGRVRRARLRAVRLDPWTVMKTAFLLSIAFAVVTLVAVTIVWQVLDASGVYDSVNRTVNEVLHSQSTQGQFNVEDFIGLKKVLGVASLICVIDVVLITAIATLGAFLYNLSASLLGGVEVTLAEDD